jgi:hypothetical protein
MIRAGTIVALYAVAAAGCSDISSPPPTSYSALARSAATASATSLSGYVSTPMGWRLTSQGHAIPAGHSLTLSSGHMWERDAAGNLVRDLGAYSSGSGDGSFIPVNPQGGRPGGGATPYLGGGWIAYTLWDRPTGHAIIADTTKWVVPPPPASWDSQTVYLFNGIQDSTSVDKSWLLQGVLQYGYSHAGGGKYWAVACWNVSESTYAFTYADSVGVGDTITAVVDSAASLWGPGYAYYCLVQDSKWKPPRYDALLLYNSNNEPWPEYWQAVEVLEAGGLTKCSDLPNTDSTAFTSIGIYAHGLVQNPLSWLPYNPVTDCGEHLNIVSYANPGGEVDVFYHGPPPPPPPPDPTVTISGPSSVRPNANCTWWAVVSGGVPPYAYSWIPGGAQTSEVTMSWSSSGTLSVWVTDSLNTGFGAHKNITVSSSAPICRQ